MTNWRKYVLWFAQEHVDFRYNEIKSLLKLWNIPCKLPETVSDPTEVQEPFCIIELPDENAARNLASRSVSIRCIFELWASSKCLGSFHTTLKNYLHTHRNDPSFTALFEKDQSFRMTVETYNKHLTQAEKVDKIESINYLPVQGMVDLKKPKVQWYYIEYYGLDANDVPEKPFDILFGKWIIDGYRSVINDISLKTRKFIGNTSMDAQLSLLMGNQAMAKPGDFVFDPFVGSGSLLVAAAKYGAYVAGTDIDYLMLHGRSRPTRINTKARAGDESVLANLKQYNCEGLYLDVLVSDFSLPIWTNNIVFDSIITDPPYGIREATEKIQSKNRPQAAEIDENLPHYPSTSNYNLSELYGDLLRFAAKNLRLGGRLVCWIPIFKIDYTVEALPKHSCLELIANSEQDLSKMTSRRLLTYEKIAQPTTNAVDNLEVFETDFREKFFTHGEETRQERRMRKAQLRENGRQEALKRGKTVDENGKVWDNKNV